MVMRPMTIVVTMRSIRNPTSPLFEVKSVLLGYVEIQPTLLYAFIRSIFIRCIFVSISPDPHISPVRRGFSPCSPLRGPSRRGSSVRRSRRRSRLRFRKGIYFWSGLLLSPLYGLLIFQNRKIISFIILCDKYRRTCSFRLNWNQKTNVM